MRAALSAVDTIEPAIPRRRLAGGGISIWRSITRRVLLDVIEKQEGRSGRERENMVKQK
jgi:hypothetical protein